jgi:hypothetical protein
MSESKQRKKPINSKAKGSEFERRIAKALGKWFKEDFNRTPASGGLHWKEDNRVAGDIVTPPDSIFPFTVECKKREGWDLDQVLKGTGEVEKWWMQAVGDSERVKLLPFLVFAKNFSPYYLMLDFMTFFKLQQGKGEQVPFNHFVVHIKDNGPRIICVLEEFTAFFTKEDIIATLCQSDS